MEHAIQQSIQTTIHSEYGIQTSVSLSRPDPQFGDYATNIALQLAGRLQRSPQDIAKEIAAKLTNLAEFSHVTVAGPGFINLHVSGRGLWDELSRNWSENYGSNNDGAGKTVIVEFPSPNMAKPYSIGHLRPGNQGWAVKRLMEETGWTVITDNHLGDYGAPFGTWVTGFLHFSSDEQLEKDGIHELGRIYIQTKQALKDEALRGETELADEVQQWLIKLEQNDAQSVEYSRRFNELSLAHIHTVMGRLGISTNYELGESFYAANGKKAVERLLRDGTATQNDDGSVIVDLSEFGFMVPLLILKSNGAALYATTDYATLLHRERQFQPDRVIYAVGSEQQFYLSQIFALAKKVGITTELIHLSFGQIDQLNEAGKREKMSSRQGVVLMETLLDAAEEKAQLITKGRDISDEDITKISIGAIKFSDFASDRRTNILFDWSTIFSLQGFSGPSVQYAAVRVNRLIQPTKEEKADGDYSGYDFEAEKSLILKITDYPKIVSESATILEPHRIARYLYELARELNRYYEMTRVLNVPEIENAARVACLQRVSHIFEHGLSILGIDIPSKM